MTDLEFVRKCVSGDKQAWDEFVARYSRLIYNYIYSVLKVKGLTLGQAQAEDIFQEIFVYLSENNYKKLKTFQARNNSSLATWLRLIVINYAINYCRRLKSVVSLDQENEDGFSLKDIIVDDSPHILEILQDKEKISQLGECIDNLSEDDQYLLELYLHQDLTLNQIMKHLRLERGAIDMRKARIIARLKDCFKSKNLWLDF